MTSVFKKLLGNGEATSVPQHTDRLPPGQVWGKRYVIYSANGNQRINAAEWKLKVSGLVNKPLEYTYDEFLRLPMKSYTRSFSCVTRWSIELPSWEGVPIRLLADTAQVKQGATWVMFHCYDGYTAPVPVEDALSEDAIVALKMNDKPLLPEQGFPARPFIPQLYGWKSAKWLGEIEFIPQYEDGYWEAYGYHERANIWEEERFKGEGYKPVPRKAFGTVG